MAAMILCAGIAISVTGCGGSSSSGGGGGSSTPASSTSGGGTTATSGGGATSTAAQGSTATQTATQTATATKSSTASKSSGSGGQASSNAAGLKVFASAGCGACHTLAAAHANGDVGPNLDDLKPSEALVAQQVANGGAAMPSFSGRLSQAQIAAVAKFVASAAG